MLSRPPLDRRSYPWAYVQVHRLHGLLCLKAARVVKGGGAGRARERLHAAARESFVEAARLVRAERARRLELPPGAALPLLYGGALRLEDRPHG